MKKPLQQILIQEIKTGILLTPVSCLGILPGMIGFIRKNITKKDCDVLANVDKANSTGNAHMWIGHPRMYPFFLVSLSMN